MQPKIYHASDHDIDPSLIDLDAITVLKRLKEAGFLAYLVGGSVRDLLLKQVPKDFDISTSASPEEIKQLFRRDCILIGRRFRLAHIRSGNKVFEVSTFRSGENDGDLIVHDNRWGTPEEDVLRRDFTINGLFYDPVSHAVIDYVGGWNDIHQRLLRTIGEPIIRFRQDPVRMIRLVKFRARFGFDADEKALQALGTCVGEIIKSSPARILEEILRMLESGASKQFFWLMSTSGLLDLLFPCLDHFLKGKHGENVYRLLQAADQLNLSSRKKTLDRATLASCLLFPILEQEIHTTYLQQGRIPHFGEILMLTSSLIKGIVISSFSHFPKRLSADVGFILSTQYRLTPISGKRHLRFKLFHHKEFEFALKFLKIRALVNEDLMEAYSWWSHQKQLADRRGERHHGHPHPPPEHKRTHHRGPNRVSS